MNAVPPPEFNARTQRAGSAAAEADTGSVRIEFDDWSEQDRPQEHGPEEDQTATAAPVEPAPAFGTDPSAQPAPARPFSADLPSGSGRGAGGDTSPRIGAIPPQLAAIEVMLSVEVGSRKVPLRELMEVDPGQLFTLDSMANEPVLVLANGRPFARGEIVTMGERFGIRLLDILAGGGN